MISATTYKDINALSLSLSISKSKKISPFHKRDSKLLYTKYLHKYRIILTSNLGKIPICKNLISYFSSALNKIIDWCIRMILFEILIQAFTSWYVLRFLKGFLLGVILIWNKRDFKHLGLVSYLGKRNQYLSIDGFDSDIFEFHRGIPHYFQLGTISFLIYTNDMVWNHSFSTHAKCS